MNPFSQNKDDGMADLPFCEAIAKEAVRNRVWVNVGKEWFAPSDFVKWAATKGNSMAHSKLTFKRDDVKLRDPVPIIAAMHAKLEKDQAKFAEFSGKVAAYFRDLR